MIRALNRLPELPARLFAQTSSSVATNIVEALHIAGIVANNDETLAVKFV
jgi:hypothetical protein